MIRILLLFVCSSCFCTLTEKKILTRIEGHMSLKDYASAVSEAEIGIKAFPESPFLYRGYLLSLMENRQEQKALGLFHDAKKSAFFEDEGFLEKFSWAILKSGTKSTNFPNRLLSLLTAGFSKDSRSTHILLKMLSDSNALLRATAAKLACQFQDAQLKDAIVSLLQKETNWKVRLELLQAIGSLKEKRAKKKLERLLEDNRSLLEEKMAAISSLVAITDDIEIDALKRLFVSDRASLRMLALQLAIYFEKKEMLDQVKILLKDPISSVRFCAMYAYGLYFRLLDRKEEVLKISERLVKDSDPRVAIVSAWTLLFVDRQKGYEAFFPFFVHEKEDIRLFASAVLAHSGKYGVDLMEKIFDHTHDQTIKLNLCLGLIGQRRRIPECRDFLYKTLMHDEQLLMSSGLAFFSIIQPSKVRYTPLSPNYPQAVDQMVRLEFLSLLSILEDPRAVDAARYFLKKSDWQVKGALAVLLLREGEEDAHRILQKLLKDKDPDVRMRAALIIALLTKDESVITSLHSFYWEADYTKKIDLLEAVGHVGSKKSIPFLIQALKDPSQKIRLVAASSIIRCLNH